MLKNLIASPKSNIVKEKLISVGQGELIVVTLKPEIVRVFTKTSPAI
jgi:hypothetical protein